MKKQPENESDWVEVPGKPYLEVNKKTGMMRTKLPEPEPWLFQKGNP